MEFQIISEYFNQQRFTATNSRLALGVGDDCALLSPRAGYQLAFSVDTLNESVHFPAGCPAEWVASRALRCNLSDLAAMGAEPLAFTLALSLPDLLVKNYPGWLQDFSAQLARESELFSVPLAGGDTTRGALGITIQIIGEVPDGQAMLRSGAKPGDDIYVTGTLGDAAAWLDDPDNEHFTHRYVAPEPRLEFAKGIRSLASSCLDISDGILSDLGHICQASQVAAEIDVDKLPVSTALSEKSNAMELALCGGDDYELCFTCAPENVADLTELAARLDMRLSHIGQISGQGESVRLIREGVAFEFGGKGYEHFS